MDGYNILVGPKANFSRIRYLRKKLRKCIKDAEEIQTLFKVSSFLESDLRIIVIGCKSSDNVCLLESLKGCTVGKDMSEVKVRTEVSEIYGHPDLNSDVDSQPSMVIRVWSADVKKGELPEVKVLENVTEHLSAESLSKTIFVLRDIPYQANIYNNSSDLVSRIHSKLQSSTGLGQQNIIHKHMIFFAGDPDIHQRTSNFFERQICQKVEKFKRNILMITKGSDSWSSQISHDLSNRKSKLARDILDTIASETTGCPDRYKNYEFERDYKGDMNETPVRLEEFSDVVYWYYCHELLHSVMADLGVRVSQTIEGYFDDLYMSDKSNCMESQDVDALYASGIRFTITSLLWDMLLCSNGTEGTKEPKEQHLHDLYPSVDDLSKLTPQRKSRVRLISDMWDCIRTDKQNMCERITGLVKTILDKEIQQTCEIAKEQGKVVQESASVLETTIETTLRKFEGVFPGEVQTTLRRLPGVKTYGACKDAFRVYVDSETYSQKYKEIKEEVDSVLRQYPCYNQCEIHDLGTAPQFVPLIEQGDILRNHPMNKYGTLGLFCWDKDHKVFMITSGHLACHGDSITLPDGTLLGIVRYSTGNQFGKTDFGYLVDVAFVEILPDVLQNCILTFKDENGGVMNDKVIVEDLETIRGETVYKHGGATGLTSGQYKGVFWMDDGSGIGTSYHFVENNLPEPFAKPGDSGALVMTLKGHESAFVLSGEWDKDAPGPSRFLCSGLVDAFEWLEEKHSVSLSLTSGSGSGSGSVRCRAVRHIRNGKESSLGVLASPD